MTQLGKLLLAVHCKRQALHFQSQDEAAMADTEAGAWSASIWPVTTRCQQSKQYQVANWYYAPPFRAARPGCYALNPDGSET